MSANNPMDPDTSPGTVPNGAGVRSVNNWPIYIGGGLFGVFLLAMVSVAANRSAAQNKPPEAKEEKAGNTSAFASQIAGSQKDGIVPSEKEANPAASDQSRPGTGALAIARPDDLEKPPTPPGNANLQNNQRNDQRSNELERIRMIKQQQLEEAIKAKTGVQVTAPRSSGSSPGGNSGTPATKEEAIARLVSAADVN